MGIRPWWWLAVLGIVALVGCTAAPAATGQAAPAQQSRPATFSIGSADSPLRVATSPAIPFVPVYATMERLRQKYGLNVKFIEIASSAERTLALVKGDVDVYAGGLATLLTQIEKDQPIVLFMNTGTLGTGIIVGKDVKGWPDLKGKQVETLRGSIMHMQLLSELKRHGLSEKDVQFKFATKPQDMLADLKQGNVVAVSGLEPFLTEAVVNGYARFLSFPYDTEVGWRAQGTWAARADFLKQHADVAQLIADENVALIKEYHDQPTKLLDDSMRLLNLKPDYRPVVEASMHNLALPVAFDDAGLKDIQGTGKFMVQFDQLKAVPDLGKAIDMSFVKKAQQKVGWKPPSDLYSVLTPPAWDPAFKFPTR